MNALWHDPPYIDRPADNIPGGKFMGSELDTWDHDETPLKTFDSLDMAIEYAKKCQLKAPNDFIVHRVWNDQKQVVARFDSKE